MFYTGRSDTYNFLCIYSCELGRQLDSVREIFTQCADVCGPRNNKTKLVFFSLIKSTCRSVYLLNKQKLKRKKIVDDSTNQHFLLHENFIVKPADMILFLIKQKKIFARRITFLCCTVCSYANSLELFRCNDIIKTITFTKNCAKNKLENSQTRISTNKFIVQPFGVLQKSGIQISKLANKLTFSSYDLFVRRNVTFIPRILR